MGNPARYWVIESAITITALLVGPVGCTSESLPAEHKHSAEATVGVRVTVAPVRTQAVPRIISSVGTLLAAEETTVGNKVDGRVAKVEADIGDRVGPGQPLVRIDATDYQWAEQQALHSLMETLAVLGICGPVKPDVAVVVPDKVQVESLAAVRRAIALAERTRAEVGYLTTAVEAAKARVAAADAELTNARDKWERNQRLHKTHVITEQELLDARTRLDTAVAARDSALADQRAALARLPSAQAAFSAAEAEVQVVITEMASRRALAQQKWAALCLARQQRADTVVTAPPLPTNLARAVGEEKVHTQSWVVAEKRTAVGEFRKVGDSLMRLVILDPLKLQVRVPERYLNQVKSGQTVELTTDATGERVLSGTVARIRPLVDPTSRNFDAEVTVPNPEGLLAPGVFARARIRICVDPAVLTVPQAAIVTFAGVTKVFVLATGSVGSSTDHIVRDRPVMLGRKLGDHVEVLSGLAVGERVVVSGHRLLADRSPVVVP